MVMSGRVNSRMTLTFKNRGEISISLTFTVCGPPKPVPACIDSLIEVIQQVDEEPAKKNRREPDYDIGDRRSEVALQLLVGDRHYVTHVPPPLAESDWIARCVVRHVVRCVLRGRIFGREVQENLLEAHSKRAKFEQAPALS